MCVCVCAAAAAVDRVLVFGLPLDCATARKTDLPCSRLWPALLVPLATCCPSSTPPSPSPLWLPRPWAARKSPQLPMLPTRMRVGAGQSFCSLGKHSAWKIVQLPLCPTPLCFLSKAVAGGGRRERLVTTGNEIYPDGCAPASPPTPPPCLAHAAALKLLSCHCGIDAGKCFCT